MARAIDLGLVLRALAFAAHKHRDQRRKGAEKRQLENVRERALELESQKRSLQETSRLKDEFLVNMSHELRTPLNGVIGFAEMMHDGMAGPLADKQKEYLSDILSSGRRFLRVINNVLDLARIEAGKLDLHPEAIDLRKLVDDVIDTLGPFLEGKDLRLQIAVDPACAAMSNDPVLLKQVLYNYLSNAIKFTPAGGAVTLRAAPEGSDALRIEVEDTGIGIPDQDVGRLFIPFEQLDAGSRKKFEGAGLGLALTKRIAEAQGGRVGVERAPGGGCIFFAVLPRILAAHSKAA